jgi:hypothetical protein
MVIAGSEAINNGTLKRESHSRLQPEILFSVYLALLIVTEEEWKSSSAFLGYLSYPLIHYVYPVIFRRPHAFRGFFIPSLFFWGVLAIITFVVLRFFERITVLRKSLAIVVGLVSVIGFPVIWLHLGNLNGLTPVANKLLVLETLVLGAAIFALVRIPLVTPLLAVTLVLAHFSLWGYVTWNAISIGFWLVYFLLGVCTSVVWIHAERTTVR